MTEELGENQQGKLTADNKVLTAIGETQSKHSLQLNVIEGKIDTLGQGQESVQAAMVKGRLEKVEDTLKEHTATLKEHTVLLKEHGSVLGQHSRQLAEIQTGVRTIIGLLNHESGSEN